MTDKRDILFSDKGKGAALTKALIMLETISADLNEAVDSGETGNAATRPTTPAYSTVSISSYGKIFWENDPCKKAPSGAI